MVAATRLPSRDGDRKSTFAQVRTAIKALCQGLVIDFDKVITDLTALYVVWVREEAIQHGADGADTWVHQQVLAGVIAEDEKWLEKGDSRYRVDLVAGVRLKVEKIFEKTLDGVRRSTLGRVGVPAGATLGASAILKSEAQKAVRMMAVGGLMGPEM